MARFAIINDICVSKVRCVFKCADIDVTGGVADRTILSSRQVVERLAGGNVAVMTRYTVIHYTHMIKRCRYKTRGYQVAGITLLINGSGRYVTNEFAHSDGIVVAVGAVMNERSKEFMNVTSSSETAG